MMKNNFIDLCYGRWAEKPFRQKIKTSHVLGFMENPRSSLELDLTHEIYMYLKLRQTNSPHNILSNRKGGIPLQAQYLYTNGPQVEIYDG